MKHFRIIAQYVIFLVAVVAGTGCTSVEMQPSSSADQSLVDLVNPLMGTDSEFSLSNGNTYPAIAVPWGMNFWTPMTAPKGDGWAYKYDDHKIRGIKQTHQPSPWINDYAVFSLMPLKGQLKINETDRASWFSHKAETVKPHYYSVYLADYDVTAEVTPTNRAAHFRFTFPESDSSYILLDAFDMGSLVEIIPEERMVVGYCRNNSGGVPENFHNYFVLQFSEDFDSFHTWTDEWALMENSTRAEADHVGAVLGFKTSRGQQITVKVASSFISLEQAKINLQNELGTDGFEATKAKAETRWQQELSRILIEDENIDNIRTFYSCLYRVLLFPRAFYEFDETGEIYHYSPYNGQVLPGYMFTDNGFWDTFRAVFPFFNMMYREQNAKIMAGLVNTYKESGWLPEWASPGHRSSMIGSNSASIIADAYLKGVFDKDADVLFEAMLKNATVEKGRPTHSVGREGVNYYNDLGYVPYNVGIRENAARTLEYAYADFCLARMAEKLGEQDISVNYYNKAQNYRNLFDSTTNLMRGRNEDGSFQATFNPLKWGDAFTEGNSLHYTWSVFQDIQGLINLMGGDSIFVGMLDSVFNMPPDYDDSYYGFTIHEIREMQIANMGNYAHGNQPIQHMIYLYNYAGASSKAQYWLRETMNRMYSPTPDGYCGDEDNGQTSAWYVFSSLGFYPVTPGVDEYVLGAPMFKKATLKLENDNQFVIKAPENSDANRYVSTVSYNGQPMKQTYISYGDLQNGGELIFNMTDKATTMFGGSGFKKPFSLTKRRSGN